MMKTHPSSQRSISKDLTIGLILVIIIVSSFALLVAYYTSKQKAEAELQAKAGEYTDYIRNTLVLPLWNYDFETIQAVCHAYLQNDLIAGIQINDPRSLVNVNMVKEDVHPTVVRTVELFHFGLPVGQAKISLAYGYLTRLNRQLFWSFALVILTNLVSLVVMTGIMLRLSLKRPLIRLNEIVGSYAAGNYHPSMQDVTHIELQPLIGTLNQMGDKIEHHLSTIRKAEKKYRDIFENALEGIYQTTPDGRILSANPAFARILGYDSAGQLMEQIEDIGRQHWKNSDERREMVRELLAHGSVTDYETRMVRRDGQLIWVQINGRPVYDASGNLLHLEGMVQDITEKMRLEDQIRQAQKMEAIGTLAGGIAHDFNNMLGVIIGCTELAMDGITEDRKAAADMERVLDASLRAKALVRQILTFSRQNESEFKPLILTPFLKEVVKFMQSTLPASTKVCLAPGSDDFTILADPTQLQQILLNLCTNAAHALSPAGGVIQISLSELIVTAPEEMPPTGLATGAYVHLAVQDNGLGITPEHLHRVFDPFFTTKKVGEGTGLGLSVVHGIVKSHGGAVYAESEPGRGTTMHVFLPSLKHPGFEPVPESTVASPEGSESIFLVEDEPVLADILRRILAGLGYQVQLYTDAVEAWRFFEGHPDHCDLALLDHNMSAITGIELAARMNRLQPQLPIMLFTGMNIELLRQDAEKAGVRRLLNKPLNRIDLALAIRKVLDEAN
jgi:two-component system, cell cycle sensor histidine kinase and response regulator CckA